MTALGEPNNCICGRTVAGNSSCPEHPAESIQFESIPVKQLTESGIPEGLYCYKRTGRVKIHNKIIHHDGKTTSVPYYFMPEIESCRFWRRTEEGAHCILMEKSSEFGDPSNLIWDQVKECDENLGEPYTLFELEEMRSEPSTPIDAAQKHAKKYPDFIQSLVGILLDSEVNEFKYDGVIYTLSHTIVNGS